MNGENNEACNDTCDCNDCEVSKKCGCSHKMLPALVIVFALNFLLGTLGVYSGYVVGIIWPILLILAAGSMIVRHKRGCC